MSMTMKAIDVSRYLDQHVPRPEFLWAIEYVWDDNAKCLVPFQAHTSNAGTWDVDYCHADQSLFIHNSGSGFRPGNELDGHGQYLWVAEDAPIRVHDAIIVPEMIVFALGGYWVSNPFEAGLVGEKACYCEKCNDHYDYFRGCPEHHLWFDHESLEWQYEPMQKDRAVEFLRGKEGEDYNPFEWLEEMGYADGEEDVILDLLLENSLEP